jgi:hypothetical protein
MEVSQESWKDFHILEGWQIIDSFDSHLNAFMNLLMQFNF